MSNTAYIFYCCFESERNFHVHYHEQISQECYGEGIYTGNQSSNVYPDLKHANVFRITMTKQWRKVVQFPSLAIWLGSSRVG